MAVEGTTWSTKCRPTLHQLCSYRSLLHAASDSIVFWPRKGKNAETIGIHKRRLILKALSIFQSSFGVYILKVEMVGHEEVFAKTGAVCCRRGAVESIDKGTCIIYSQGPERLTKMSGNKASCYFLTAVQTCIDRNLAPQKKNETPSGWRQTKGALLSVCAASCLCASNFLK